MLKIICFWKGFNNNNNFITDIIKNNNIELKSDILIVGSFISSSDINFIKKFKGKKILFITEPLPEFGRTAYKLYKKNMFNYISGCIDESHNHIKYPLYLLYNNFADPNTYLEANKFVKSTDISTKKFACLINSHDKGNTRTSIYNKLRNIGHIDCPGNLLNNCSNVELNKVGKQQYLHNYLFNICPENFNTNTAGYITEKLLQSCLGGSIPIYFGKLDDIDKRIFNINRIILFDPFNIKSTDSAVALVKNLYENKDKLLEYYQQPPFCDNAIDVFNDMQQKFVNMLK